MRLSGTFACFLLLVGVCSEEQEVEDDEEAGRLLSPIMTLYPTGEPTATWYPTTTTDYPTPTSSPTAISPACRATVLNPEYIGDGFCHSGTGYYAGGYNTEACEWDGGDCCPETCAGGTCGLYTGAPYVCLDPAFTAISTECSSSVEEAAYIGDGYCNADGGYNTEVCGWDGGDCCEETCIPSDGPLSTACEDPQGFDCKDPSVASASPTFDATPVLQIFPTVDPTLSPTLYPTHGMVVDRWPTIEPTIAETFTIEPPVVETFPSAFPTVVTFEPQPVAASTAPSTAPAPAPTASPVRRKKNKKKKSKKGPCSSKKKKSRKCKKARRAACKRKNSKRCRAFKKRNN